MGLTIGNVVTTLPRKKTINQLQAISSHKKGQTKSGFFFN